MGAAVICASLLAAPAQGSVGKQSYEGLVATEGFMSREPMVRMKIEFEKKDGKRGRPKSLIVFDHRAIRLYCPEGATSYAGPPTGLDLGPGAFAFVEFTGQKVKKGRFKVNETDTLGETADEQYITGRVGKKGNATGTIHLLNAYSGGGKCDSGVVNWTAQPVAKFSPPEIPPCAFSGTCPVP